MPLVDEKNASLQRGRGKGGNVLLSRVKPPVVPVALFRLLPPASLLVGHDGLNAIVMGGFE